MSSYHLVEHYISHETADYLTQVALDAQSGIVVGVAAVVLLAGRRYCVNATGSAKANATLARGCVRSLDDYLATFVAPRQN